MNPDFVKKHIPLGTFVKVTEIHQNGAHYGTLIDMDDKGYALRTCDDDGGGILLLSWKQFEMLADGDCALAGHRIGKAHASRESAYNLALADIRRERENAAMAE